MGMREYSDFVIIAEDVQKDDRGVVDKFTVNVFDSPVGQGEKKETVTISKELKLIGRIQDLERRSLDQDVERQIELGEILAALLLPKYARELFFASYNRVNEDQGLRLRLRLADELADFPWEYMYIQRAHGEKTPSSFLALDPKISIVRHDAIAVPGDWFSCPDTRRIVIAMASPEPHTQYRKLDNLPIEQKLIRQALSSIPGIKAEFFPDYSSEDLDALPGTTVKDLTQALSEHTDVFHFSGHGEFDKRNGPAYGSIIGEGGIVLADQNNQAAMIPGDRLSEILHNKGVRLAILGACETGRRDGHNVWSSVVASLLKKGIPAVVSMQFTVMDRLAAAFSAALYRGLVAGKTVDEAVSLGRAAIRMDAINGNSDIRDWGVPVLYLRSPGGRVFQPVGNEVAQRDAEMSLDHLIKQQARVISEGGEMVGLVAKELRDQTITVDQTITERVKGIVVGANIFSIDGGRLIVKQKADAVEGPMTGFSGKEVRGGNLKVDQEVGEVKEKMVGAIIDTLGGLTSVQHVAKMPSENETMEQLEKALVVKPAWQD